MRLGKIAIVIVAAGFIGWVFYALNTAEPVSVEDTVLQHKNGQVFVTGKIRNTGTDEGPIDIEVHYYDRSGHAVGQDKIVVERLEKGQSEPFQSPPRMLGEGTTFSVYLNHGRNPYGN